MFKFGLLIALFFLLSTAVYAQNQIVFINGHPMIALENFSNQFGASVGYDETQQAILISLGDQTVSFVPYSSTAWINGNPVALDSPVVIIDNVTYIPLQFMCYTFNMNCTWGNDNQQVVIINLFTRQPITFYRDFTWGRRRHVWRYHYNYNDYRRFNRGRVYPGGQPGHPGYGQTPGHGRPPGFILPPGGQTPGHGRPPGFIQPPGGQMPGHGLPPGHGQPPGFIQPPGGQTPGHGLPPGHGQPPGFIQPPGGQMPGHGMPPGHGQSPGFVQPPIHVQPPVHGQPSGGNQGSGRGRRGR